MLKKVLSIVISVLLGLGLFSCKNLISDSDDKDALFGSLVVSTGNGRALDVSSIKYARVVVSGPGIESDLSTTVEVSGGKNSGDITIENIPAGRNRIVSVYARDENGDELFGGAIRNLVDIGGSVNSCYVTSDTTALGNVFFYLNEFDRDLSSTTGANYVSKDVEFKELKKKIQYDVWDTAGQEQYRGLSKIFYKDASIVILVFDITNEKSFVEIKDFWYNEIKENAPEGTSKTF